MQIYNNIAIFTGWESKQEVTFDVWYQLIKRNFERNFWVDSSYTSLSQDPHPDFINRRNIYKDCVGATPQWTDYQLRPNFPIAIALVCHEILTVLLSGL